MLIGRCAIYEKLYLTGDIPMNAEEATKNLRRALTTLYTAILQALCRLIRIFQGMKSYCLFHCVYVCVIDGKYISFTHFHTSRAKFSY